MKRQQSISKPSHSQLSSFKLKGVKSCSKLEAPKNPSFSKTPLNLSLPKASTFSTLPNSPTAHSLDSLSSDLKTVKILKSLNEKLQKILGICEMASKISPPFSNFIQNLKEEIQLIFSSFNSKFSELRESSQAIKILKKRFLKLAIENLELNNLIVEKELKIFRLGKKNLEIKEKLEEFNKSQTEALNIKVKKYIDRYFLLKEKTLAYLQLTESNKKEQEVISKIYKENIFDVIESSELRSENDNSITFKSQRQSIIIGNNTSNYNSFLSSVELISNLP